MIVSAFKCRIHRTPCTKGTQRKKQFLHWQRMRNRNSHKLCLAQVFSWSLSPLLRCKIIWLEKSKRLRRSSSKATQSYGAQKQPNIAVPLLYTSIRSKSNTTLSTNYKCTNTLLHEHTELTRLEAEMSLKNNYRRDTWGFPNMHTHTLPQQQPRHRASMFPSILGFSADNASQTARGCCVGWGTVYFYCDHFSSETYTESISYLQMSPHGAIQQQSLSITANLPVNAWPRGEGIHIPLRTLPQIILSPPL